MDQQEKKKSSSYSNIVPKLDAAGTTIRRPNNQDGSGKETFS